jgi:hippurate hydrolase
MSGHAAPLRAGGRPFAQIAQFHPELTALRRDLHAHPELGFEEVYTGARVREALRVCGVDEIHEGIGKTGLVGVIHGRGRGSGAMVGLRADMDALPMTEHNEFAWRSVKSGLMHGCGHDGHTAMLVGAARYLAATRDFDGQAVLIFQPGEEKAPGGARLMLEDGVFDEIKPELIIAQHVSVDYPTGTLGFLPGMIMASADEIHVKINGKGGHGALPHLTNDTVLCAAQTLVSLQQVRSRLCSPLIPMVLTFGKLQAGSAQNIIPHEALLSGTLRTVDEQWREKAKIHIRRIINETCAAYGCTAEIEIPDGYPCVVNDVKTTLKARQFATEWVGNEKVVDLEMRMTSEDFAFFTQQYPCTFYRFGVRGASNADTGGLHSANFCIDEEALITGFGGMAWLAWKFIT